MIDWSDFLTSVEPRHRVTEGNRLTHLRDDDRAVRSIWRRIEEATERVWMSMYVLEPDKVGFGTIDRLRDAAFRGCDVRLVYDFHGSHRLRSRHLEPLSEAGARFAAFNRYWPPWSRKGVLGIRNHRKLIIVDASAALCGGLNLSEEYVDVFGEEWIFDDTVVMLEGPSVFDLMEIFQRTWHEVTHETIDLPPQPTPFQDGVLVQVLETDPRRDETRLREMLDAAVKRARKRCLLVTPYFIPADWLTNSLLDALGRGAQVEIVTAGRTDLRIARGAARDTYGPLLEAGARIYEMFGRMIHSKMIAIDGRFGTVGSYNLDRWTARHTLDVSIAFVSDELSTSMEEEFEQFARDSTEFTLAEHKKRGLPTRLLHRASSRIVDAL